MSQTTDDGSVTNVKAHWTTVNCHINGTSNFIGIYKNVILRFLKVPTNLNIFSIKLWKYYRGTAILNIFWARTFSVFGIFYTSSYCLHKGSIINTHKTQKSLEIALSEITHTQKTNTLHKTRGRKPFQTFFRWSRRIL